MPTPKGNRSLQIEQKIQDTLADLGLSECITYALSSKEAERKLVPGAGELSVMGGPDYVTLVNPVSPERAVMRRTLLPGLLEVAARNLQSAEGVALFEFGFVYLLAGGELPDEPRRVAVVLCGRRSAGAWDDPLGVKPKAFDFFDLKGVVESLAAALHLGGMTFEPTTAGPHLHPGKAAVLKVNGAEVGTLGELHPKVAAVFGLADRAVQVAELDAEALIAATPERYPYRPFSTLPAAKRDVAVIVPDDMPAEKVLGELRAGGGELLTEVSLFDVYRGESIPAGTKSLAFALTYQPKEKTLTDKEIDKAHEKIEGRLRNVLKAKIRGKDA
ncbi:MAG: hypothetical protein MUF18_13755 [Fimbriiglobus sp.]|nr:hypothetical protein [Fimbriiglobus sp.]